MLMIERGDHAGRVDVEKVGQDGSARQETLLPRQDPFGEVFFPSVAGGAGDYAVVAVDDVEWSGAAGSERSGSVRCGAGAFLGQANQGAFIIVVWVVLFFVVVSTRHGFHTVWQFKALGHVVKNGDPKVAEASPCLEWYAIWARGGVAAIFDCHLNVFPSDVPCPRGGWKGHTLCLLAAVWAFGGGGRVCIGGPLVAGGGACLFPFSPICVC